MNNSIKTKKIKKEQQKLAYETIKSKLKESNISERKMATLLNYDRGLVNRAFSKIYIEACLHEAKEYELLENLEKMPLTLFRVLLKFKREKKERVIYFFKEFNEIIEEWSISDLKSAKILSDLFLSGKINNKDDYSSMPSIDNPLKREIKELKLQLKDAKSLIKKLEKENEKLNKRLNSVRGIIKLDID